MQFALLSAISFAGYLVFTAILHDAIGINAYLSVAVAMVCITLFNFITLRRFIFEPTSRSWLSELIGFLASIAGFRVAEYAAFLLIHGALDTPYLLAYAGILGASALCKFIFLRNILFAKTLGKPPLARATP